MCEALLQRSNIRHSSKRFLVVLTAVLLAWASPIAAQGVGPSGCVQASGTCGSGGGGSRGGGGGGYNPYAGMAAGALGAFMQGFMNEMQRANDPRRRATALNNKGVQYENAGDYIKAVQYYEAALRLNPNNRVARNNLKNVQRRYREQLEKIAEKRRVAAADSRARGTILAFSRDITASGPDTGTAELTMMDLGDTKQAPEPEPSLQEEKARVGARLDEVKEKILNAPPGKSAWDGGYGGTLDSLEAAGVSRPVTDLGARAVQTGAPRYERAAPATQTGAPTAEGSGGTPAFIGAENTAPPSKEIQVPSDLRDQVASLPSKEIPTLKPEKGPAVLDKNTNYSAVKAGVMEWVATGKKPKLDTRIPEPVYPPKSLKAEVLLDSLQYGNGDWDKSRRYLEDLKKKNPKQTYIQAAIDDLNSARASAYWKKVEEVNKETKPSPPFDGKTRELIEKGGLMVERGDLLRARQFYMQAYMNRTDSKAVGKLLNQVHHKLLAEAKDLQEKARLNIRAGNYGEARQQLQEAWVRKPVDKFLREQLIAVSRNDISAILHAGKKPVFEKGAEEILQQGFEYRNQKQYGEALVSFSNAAKLDPGNRIIRDNFYYTKGAYEAQQRARGVKFLGKQAKEPYDAAKEIMFSSNPPKPLDDQTRKLTDGALKAIEKGDFNGALANLREAEIRRSDIPGIRDIRLQTEGAYHSQLRTE